MTAGAEAATGRASHGRWAAHATLAACGGLSIALVKLAPFTLLGAFLGYLSLPRERPRGLTWLALLGALGSLAGFVRFLVAEAVPGMVQAGSRATGDAAVSKLREIVFAEDQMRRHAFLDPDGDGVGSAALLEELSGRAGLRGGRRLTPPLLERSPPIETALGPAIERTGYLFIVCLPTPDGGWTAAPGARIDDEAAERRFVAYAWPAARGHGLARSFFIDEHERILFVESGAPAGHERRVGPSDPPACDDALAPATREAWQVWRGKRPRSELPGEIASKPPPTPDP